MTRAAKRGAVVALACLAVTVGGWAFGPVAAFHQPPMPRICTATSYEQALVQCPGMVAP